MLLVDDHALVRDGMAQLLRQVQTELKLLHAGSLHEAMSILDAAHAVDLILLDLALPDSQGPSAVQRLRQLHPKIPVVVVSAETSTETVQSCLDAGAMSFISKQLESAALLDAVESVIRGGVVLPSSQPLLEPVEELMLNLRLNGRRLQILRLLVQGHSTRQIAEALSLSESTIKSHLGLVYRSLGVNSRTGALFALSRLGLDLSDSGLES